MLDRYRTNYFLKAVLKNTPYSKLQVVKKLGAGSFNTVWSTTNPKYTARVSNRRIEKRDEKDEEIKFIKRVNAKYPGRATPKMYFSYFEIGDYSLEIMEAYDRDLRDFFQDDRVPAQKKKKALIDSIELIGKLLDIGVYCWDQKPGNFLVMEKGTPHGRGKKRKSGQVFVRITDLGADFCVQSRRLPSGKKGTRWGRKARCFSTADKELFLMIEILQMCSMTLYTDPKLGPVVQSVFSKYDNEFDICGRKDDLKEFLESNAPSWFVQQGISGKMTEWNKIVKQLFHYGDGARNTYAELDILCTPPRRKEYQKTHYKSIKSCSFGKLKRKQRKKSPPKRRKARPGKVLNPKTGRYVNIDGKIGRKIRGRKPGKSCTRLQMINPKTGRCVKIDGKIGRKLLQRRRKTPRFFKTTRSPSWP